MANTLFDPKKSLILLALSKFTMNERSHNLIRRKLEKTLDLIRITTKFNKNPTIDDRTTRVDIINEFHKTSVQLYFFDVSHLISPAYPTHKPRYD